MKFSKTIFILALLVSGLSVQAQDQDVFQQQHPGFKLRYASHSIDIENFQLLEHGMVIMFNSLSNENSSTSFVAFDRENLPTDTLTIQCVPAFRSTAFWFEDNRFFYRPELVLDKQCKSNSKDIYKTLNFIVFDNTIQTLNCLPDIKTTSLGKGQRSDTYRFKNYTLIKSSTKNEIEIRVNNDFKLSKTKKDIRDQDSFSPEIIFKHYVKDSISIIFDTHSKTLYQFVNGALAKTTSLIGLTATPQALDFLYDDLYGEVYIRESKVDSPELVYLCYQGVVSPISLKLPPAKLSYSTVKVPLKRAMKIHNKILYSVMKIQEDGKSYDGLFYAEIP